MTSISPKTQELPDYTPALQHLMRAAGLGSFAELGRQGISRGQIRRLRRGEITQLRVETLLHLAKILKVSLPQLIESCSSLKLSVLQQSPRAASTPQLQQESQLQNQLQKEYQRLQVQLAQQQQALQQDFQQQALQTLEPFLTYWPTAAHAARQNPAAPAVNLLPLVRPVEQLLQIWGVVPIGEVGATLPFDPQAHQTLTGEEIAPGTPVTVAHLGYRQGERLLYRAKVRVL